MSFDYSKKSKEKNFDCIETFITYLGISDFNAVVWYHVTQVSNLIINNVFISL